MRTEIEETERRGIGSPRQSYTRPNNPPQPFSAVPRRPVNPAAHMLVQAVIVALIDTIPGKDHRPAGCSLPMLELLVWRWAQQIRITDLIGFLVFHGESRHTSLPRPQRVPAYAHDPQPLFPPHGFSALTSTTLQPPTPKTPMPITRTHTQNTTTLCQYRLRTDFTTTSSTSPRPLSTHFCPAK